MNAEKVNTWLSLGANIGVVIGLMLLIIEIGQNTDMMRAQIIKAERTLLCFSSIQCPTQITSRR